MSSALTPSSTFIETMTHQTRVRTQPVLIRSSVMAKEVLLHAEARMASVPEMLMRRGILKRKLEMGMSQMCLP